MIIPVSYPLAASSPLYPGTPATRIFPDKAIAAGSSANTSVLTFSSHAGTHLDVPRHFCSGGKTVRDLLGVMNVYSPTYCLDLPGSPDRGIVGAELAAHLCGMHDAEAILLRTGSGRQRMSNPGAYAATHPWIRADVAGVLRARCPRIRLLGVDTISISVPSHREDGRESHRAFLCDPRPVCLLEDADLFAVIPGTAYTLVLMPWLAEELDGVPVTAFLDDRAP